MTWVLVRKLLRDVRVPLLVVGLLLGAFKVCGSHHGPCPRRHFAVPCDGG